MAGQRDKARRIASGAPSGSLGRDAIYPNFDSFWARAAMNFCAGEVGDLYERERRQIEQPATDENIEKWAEMETRYFQMQGGCTAILGSALSRDDRIRMMKAARDRGRTRR